MFCQRHCQENGKKRYSLGEKICRPHVGKGLACRAYKRSQTPHKKTTQLAKSQRSGGDTSPKRTHRWQVSKRKKLGVVAVREAPWSLAELHCTLPVGGADSTALARTWSRWKPPGWCWECQVVLRLWAGIVGVLGSQLRLNVGCPVSPVTRAFTLEK